MNPITQRKIALQVLILLGLVFGALAWIQQPESALLWLTGMLTLPVAWALVALTGALPGPARPESQRIIYNSLIGAAVLITATLGVGAAVTYEAIPADWSTRFGMLASALVLIVIGNGLPKKIEPGCSRSQSQAIQRLLGWTFVVTGLIAIAVWLIMPVAVARMAGLALYGAAVVFAVVAILQIRQRTVSG